MVWGDVVFRGVDWLKYYFVVIGVVVVVVVVVWLKWVWCWVKCGFVFWCGWKIVCSVLVGVF